MNMTSGCAGVANTEVSATKSRLKSALASAGCMTPSGGAGPSSCARFGTASMSSCAWAMPPMAARMAERHSPVWSLASVCVIRDW